MAPSPVVIGSLVVTLGIGIATATYQYWLRPTLENCIRLHDYLYSSSRSSSKQPQKKSDVIVDDDDQPPKDDKRSSSSHSFSKKSHKSSRSSKKSQKKSDDDDDQPPEDNKNPLSSLIITDSDSDDPGTRRLFIETELMNTDHQLDQLRSRREILESQLSQLLVHNVEKEEVIFQSQFDHNVSQSVPTLNDDTNSFDDNKPISEPDSFDLQYNEINQLYPTVNQDILINPSTILPLSSSPIPSINPNMVTIPILSTNPTLCDTNTETESISRNSDSSSNRTHVDDDQRSDSEFSLISAGSAYDNNIR